MIRHIVTFKLADESGGTRASQAIWAAGQLTSLVPLIPEIISLTVVHDVHHDAGNSDFALIADFADQAALDAYQAHPDHVRVTSTIRPLVASRLAVDFEV
ncbi:Dabb family protein [soil metagenome]